MRRARLAWALPLLAACAERPPPAPPAASVWEAARQRGVDFRAVGQEPGWLLEIVEGETITLATDYGARRLVGPAPAPERDAAGGRRSYRLQADGQALTILLEARPCADAMSGEMFPTAVLLLLDGRRYEGCGRALR